MGYIRRIGVNTNWTVEATTGYSVANPGTVAGPWTDATVLDQSLHQAGAASETHEGCLATFSRYPAIFFGIMAKLTVTYDAEVHTPIIEFWVENVASGWRLMASYNVLGMLEAAPSGEAKIYDVGVSPNIADVRRVWVVLNPGPVPGATLTFKALQLFGACDDTQKWIDNPTEDPCANPNDPFYAGFDANGEPCVPEPPGGGKDPCERPDLCDPASVEAFRTCLEGYDVAFREAFDAYMAANAEAIALFCKGGDDPPPLPPPPPWLIPPVLPDLCDMWCDDTIRTDYRAILTPAQLETFDAWWEGMLDDGFQEFVCPSCEPEETCVDPITLGPCLDEPPTKPGGGGPGGKPDPTPQPQPEPTPVPIPPANIYGELLQRFIITWSGNDLVYAASVADTLVAPISPSTATQKHPPRILDNYGPPYGTQTLASMFNPAVYGWNINLTELPPQSHIGLRCRRFLMPTGFHPATDLKWVISETGINEDPGCITSPIPSPPDPDLILAPFTDTNLTGPVGPVIGDNFWEFKYDNQFELTPMEATFTLTVPREDETQNDSERCSGAWTPAFKVRSNFGHTRGGLLDTLCVPVVNSRERWFPCISVEDRNQDPYYISSSGSTALYWPGYFPPIAFILDVIVVADSPGVAQNCNATGISLTGLSDNQPQAVCNVP